MVKIIKNLMAGTFLWSQVPNTDWYWENREKDCKNYKRLVLTWGGKICWSSRLSNWLFAGWTLSGFGAPKFFITEGPNKDRKLKFSEKLVIVVIGILLHILSPRVALRKILHPGRVQNFNIED
jgi:hypothetical protein